MLAKPQTKGQGQGRDYFEIDESYYLDNELQEFADCEFYGELKKDLGIDKFNLQDFDSLLGANHPKSGERLLNLSKKDLDQNGDRKKSFLDMTFSADKSISILYETADEHTKKQIKEAFDKSVNEALDYVQKNYAFQKDRNENMGLKAEEKLIFAKFSHYESRDNQSHLHTHSLLMNICQDKEGNYRSMDFGKIKFNYQLIGQIQRNALAQEMQKLGYEIDITDTKKGLFALKNVDADIREAMSSRSQAIKEEMAKTGNTSYEAAQVAQKKTRQWKDKSIGREEIEKQNLEFLKSLDANIEKIQTVNPELKMREMTAAKAISIAFEDVTDKQSVFKREDIIRHSLKVSLGTNVSISDIEKEYDQKVGLIAINEQKNQYTTQEILEKENFIFSLKTEKSFVVSKSKTEIEKAIKTFEKEKGFELKQGQRDLANTVLSSDSQFIIAQGVAGAGKSTSLEIVRKVAESNDINIVALAPTGTATDNLAKEAGITQNMTVAKFIQENGADIKDSLVIVDEAGMMGLRDTHDLMKIAKENNLKIVFSGDMNQKKSISQGDIFPGMQRKGFETVNLAEGNRQKTDKMRLAVKNILDKDIVSGLEILKDTTFEMKGDERLNAAMRQYLKDRDNSLLITTTNSDRVKLNEMIRNHLLKTNEITKSKEFDLRETINLSDLEKRSALHYKEGQKVFLSKNLGSISAGREALIKNVDLEKNQITIENKSMVKGKEKITTETVDLTSEGSKLNLFEDKKRELGVGEQVIMKKNDKKLGLSNGQMGKITNIEKDKLTVLFDKKEVVFSVKDYKYINHAYAITDFASQGKTTDKVIAVANSQAASFNDFYTQITRAKNEAVIITDSIEELQKRAALDSVKLNATEQIEINQKEKIMKKELRENQERLKKERLEKQQQEQKEQVQNQTQKEENKKESSIVEKVDKANDMFENYQMVNEGIEYLSKHHDFDKEKFMQTLQQLDGEDVSKTLGIIEEVGKNHGEQKLKHTLVATARIAKDVTLEDKIKLSDVVQAVKGKVLTQTKDKSIEMEL
ncbi:MAG: MobF family relaxase [Arcobacteraceae bacterium]